MTSSDWFDRAGAGSQVDAAEIVSGIAAQGITELVDAGALVSIGKTSDGGALGVTVTVDGRYRREYFRTSEELALWIAEALPAVHEARGRGDRRPSGGSGNVSRRSRTPQDRR